MAFSTLAPFRVQLPHTPLPRSLDCCAEYKAAMRVKSGNASSKKKTETTRKIPSQSKNAHLFFYCHAADALTVHACSVLLHDWKSLHVNDALGEYWLLYNMTWVVPSDSRTTEPRTLSFACLTSYDTTLHSRIMRHPLQIAVEPRMAFCSGLT